ncbi:MAG: hemerythrin family protein [Magnetococcales bacterium]|nr:hemerythrin family protein [Magnetococcales bacterium]
MAVIILSSKKLSYKWLRFPVTGIVELDQQHQELLDRMNTLRDYLTRGQAAPEEVQERLHALHTLFSNHFEEENQRMQAHDYPGFTTHFEAHQAFLNGPILHTITDPHGQEGYDLGALVEWEASHISRFDRPMAEFLLARGEKSV